MFRAGRRNGERLQKHTCRNGIRCRRRGRRHPGIGFIPRVMAMNVSLNGGGHENACQQQQRCADPSKKFPAGDRQAIHLCILPI